MKRKIKLTAEEKLFIVYYLRYNNAGHAYKLAFNINDMTLKQLAVYGKKLLTNSHIEQAIEKERLKLVNSVKLEIQDLVADWKKILYADINDIMQIRRINCRYCFGKNHNYQYINQDEFLKTVTQDNRGIVENTGGVGYNFSKEPHPDCLVCGGEGIEHYYINDTRTLTDKEKLIYNGFERVGNRTRVVLRDKDLAAVNLAKFLGVFEKNKKPTEIIINKTKNDSKIGDALKGVTDQEQSLIIYKEITQN